MRKTLLASLITLLPAFFLQADIAGVYDIAGFDPYSDSHYGGTVHIEKHSGHHGHDCDNHDTYAIHWFFDDGSQDKGVGIHTEDHLSIAFTSALQPSASSSGVQVYKIKHDELKGPWTLSDGQHVGFERAFKADEHHHHCD